MITKNSVSISNFFSRHLTQDDWRIFRDIRLEALALEGSKFGCSLSVESAYTEKEWRSWLSASDKDVYGLFNQTNLIGIIGSITWHPSIIEISEAKLWSAKEITNSAFCIALYLKQAYRQHSLPRKLFRDSLSWLINTKKCEQLLMAHRSSNLTIRRFVIAYGFTEIEQRPYTWPDGGTESIHIYKCSPHQALHNIAALRLRLTKLSDCHTEGFQSTTNCS